MERTIVEGALISFLILYAPAGGRQFETYLTLSNCEFRTLADVDGDNVLDVVELTGKHVNVYTLQNHAPAWLPGWPQDVPNRTGSVSHARSRLTPAAGEVRLGHAGPEIAALSSTDGQYCGRESHVTLFGADASRQFTVAHGCATGYVIALEDLDGDGEAEIIAGGAGYDYHGVVLAYRSDGTLLPGWPFTQDRKTDSWGSASLAIGDVHGGSSPEIVFCPRRQAGWLGSTSLSVLDRDGRVLAEWRNPDVEGAVERIALANLDADAAQEVLILTGGRDYGVLRGFDVETQSELFSTSPFSRSNWGPVMADLDGDGWTEIVVTTRDAGGQVRLFDHLGNELRAFAGPSGEPSLADVDGDGVVEIVCLGSASPRRGMYLHAVRWTDGTQPDGWPVYIRRLNHDSNYSQPCIGDVDSDGLLEVLVNKAVVELTTPATGSSLPWPMFMRDPQHTGCMP